MAEALSRDLESEQRRSSALNERVKKLERALERVREEAEEVEAEWGRRVRAAQDQAADFRCGLWRRGGRGYEYACRSILFVPLFTHTSFNSHEWHPIQSCALITCFLMFFTVSRQLEGGCASGAAGVGGGGKRQRSKRRRRRRRAGGGRPRRRLGPRAAGETSSELKLANASHR